MTIKEYTYYMLNNYTKEIIEEYYDAKGARKNRIKSQDKKEQLKKVTQEIFHLNNLITELKTGPAYNCTDNP